MSEPGPEWMLVSWVRLVQARWIATGVSRTDRSDLLRQLLRDLAAARAAGATIEELVATPPAAFADSCAAGLGSRLAGIDTARLLLVCLGTGVAATGVAWVLLLNVLWPSVAPLGLDEDVFYLFVDLFVAAVVLATMVVAVRWTFRRRREAAALAPRLAVTLTGGALLGFPLASAYGAAHSYVATPDVVGVEVLIVLAFLSVATLAAQRWTQPRRPLGRAETAS